MVLAYSVRFRRRRVGDDGVSACFQVCPVCVTPVPGKRGAHRGSPPRDRPAHRSTHGAWVWSQMVVMEVFFWIDTDSIL